jgi:hypothetical protein
MFTCKKYENLFKELVETNKELGPFNVEWCNVALAKFHVLQNTEINSTEELSQ